MQRDMVYIIKVPTSEELGVGQGSVWIGVMYINRAETAGMGEENSLSEGQV